MNKYLASLIFSFLVIAMLFPSVSFAQFSDVQKDSLTYMYRHGIIDGYPDGTFGPDNTINRAELLKMIMDASYEEVSMPSEDCFSDVPKAEWYAPYVCTAFENGWVEGYADGQFKPAQSINKVEALKIIAEVQGWLESDECSSLESSFSDVEQCAWYYNYVVTAEDHFFVDAGGSLIPGDFISRDEVAEILFRTIIEAKLGRIGTRDTAEINDTLPAMARDFFKVENAALSATYEDATTEATNAAENPHHVEGFTVDDAVYENRITLFALEDGTTYAVLPVKIGASLESDRCPQDCTALWMLAKFDSEQKLVAFDWKGIYIINHQVAAWNILSVDFGKALIETWYDDATESTPTGKSEPFTLVLEDMR